MILGNQFDEPVVIKSRQLIPIIPNILILLNLNNTFRL